MYFTNSLKISSVKIFIEDISSLLKCTCLFIYFSIKLFWFVIRYITKGDNNNVPDLQKISFEQIEGVEILRIPYLGQIVSAMENQVILLIIILLILIIYLYSLNTKEKSEIRRAKRMKYMEENHNNKL